ncbi:MAG: GNAT family N-acetyltransferase [Schleiferiaceae bacterium]|nr:GNAT family N-acetyltransferase [Schleiferiaceae bacterium]
MIGPLFASFSELNTSTLYGILALRAEVFVVEQDCPYQDLDGKDEQSIHLWYEEEGCPVAYARLLPPGSAYAEAGIGRVVTAQRLRRTGLGKELMRAAIDRAQMQWPGEDLVIMAQSYLVNFYQGFGFEIEREEFLEDGIPHRWMRFTA